MPKLTFDTLECLYNVPLKTAAMLTDRDSTLRK
jgi:hypothetical protein